MYFVILLDNGRCQVAVLLARHDDAADRAAERHAGSSCNYTSLVTPLSGHMDVNMEDLSEAKQVLMDRKSQSKF